MRKRLTSLSIVFVLISVVSASDILAQQRRGRGAQRPASTPAPAPDLRIKYRTTTSGQSSESVTMIKGARERSEMHSGYGMATANITQCDLKRTIQLSDKTRKFLITPMVTGDSTASGSQTAATTAASEPVRRGGVVNYVTTATDTGERKEMFGFTARHVKTSMSIDSSPDSCYPVKQRMETDGWYIDIAFGLDCNLARTQAAGSRYVPPGGCRDQVNFKQEGSARTGYPLSETMTMYGPDGKIVFTSTKEVLELSREPLDAALFDVPAGYTEATNTQELYAAPSTPAMMQPTVNDRQTVADNSSTESHGMGPIKQPGMLRVGVVTINNKTDRPVSLDSLRQRLVGGIEGAGIDAVALNAATTSEAEAEAKAKQCDFILYTDISTLKIAAAKKLGGLLGRAAGVSGIEKSESRVDFRLFAVGVTSPQLQSSATAKEEGDESSIAKSLDTEARLVSAEVRKKVRD